MNERFSRQVNTYRRSLEDKKIYTTLYAVLLVFALVVYGLLGIVPLVQVTRRKLTTLADLKTLNRNLEMKRDSLSDVKDKIDLARAYIYGLDEAVPVQPTVETYMVGLVGSAATTGFKQRSLYVQTFDDESLELSATFQGSALQLASMLQALEAAERLTVLERFNYTLREETANLDMVLKIYYLERR